MNDSSRKILKIIVGIIWFAGGVIFAIRSEYLSAILFFLIGILFFARGLKKGKKE